MEPQASVISEHLGDVYTKMNLHDKARLLFIKAAEAEGDFDRKKEIKSKLTQTEDRISNARSPSSTGPSSNTGESP